MLNYNMKKYLLIAVGAFLLLIGAGCAEGQEARLPSPALGKDDAPLQMTEWYDFQCPACKNYESVMRFVVEDYVNTGKVRLTYKNMAFLGSESKLAANAAFCAHEQGKFKEYFDKLYENQGEENSGVFNKNFLKKLGGELGLNAEQFNACVDARKYNGQVAEELRESRVLGVRGTPTLFLNGKEMRLPRSYLEMKQKLEEELAKTGRK